MKYINTSWKTKKLWKGRTRFIVFKEKQNKTVKLIILQSQEKINMGSYKYDYIRGSAGDRRKNGKARKE